MLSDSAAFIGTEAKAIMELIAGIDEFTPEEDMLEVLIGEVKAWGAIETRLLYPTLESALEGCESTTAPARERLDTLRKLEGMIHTEEETDVPLNDLAAKYVGAVKYHLAADVQEIIPLTDQLPIAISTELAHEMAAMKRDLE